MSAAVAPAQVADEVRRGLRAVARPQIGPAMRAYMKSKMPFLGVPAAPLRTVCSEVLTRLPLPDRGRWELAGFALWDDALFCEERYAALS